MSKASCASFLVCVGTCRRGILDTRLYTFESSVEQGSLMYTYLALGLANVFCLQAKILEEDDAVRALVFHTPSCEYIREHKGKVLGFGVKISKIKMTPTAQDKIIIDPLDIIVWLFDHAEAKHLNVA